MDFKMSAFSLDIMEVRDTVILRDSYKELDNVILRVKLTERRQPVTLFGKTVRLFAIKPDGEPVYQESNISFTDPAGGVVDIILTKAALNQIGTVKAEIEIINSDGTLMTTGNFKFDVVDKLNDLDTDEEIVENIDFLKELQEFLTSTRPEEEGRERSEEERRREERERETAESQRVANEQQRQASFSDMEKKINIGITTSDIDAIISEALK